VAPLTIISLIFDKQCSKVISQNKKFILFVIHDHDKYKVTTYWPLGMEVRED
jgi:hypothetical protein